MPTCFLASAGEVVGVASGINVESQRLCCYRLRFHACWWAAFWNPKTSSVSSKANTADSRTEGKKETENKSRV